MKSSKEHQHNFSSNLGVELLRTKINQFVKNIRINSEQYLTENLFNSKNPQGEIIQQSPLWARSTIIGLMGTALFGVAWLAFAKTDEVVTVTGKLEPLGSVQNIQMPLGGIASEILVKDGEEVEAGQVVMKLDAEMTQKRLESLQENYKLKNIQLNLKQEELDQFLLLNDEITKTLTQNLKIQKTILKSFEFLRNNGASSELQYLQQLNSVQELAGKLSQANIDKLRQKAVQDQQIQQLKSELKDLESKVTDAEVNLRYQSLKSPVSGIVFDLQPHGKGYVAQGTETVMKIVPYENLRLV